MLSDGTAYTPTPAVSHAILIHNQGRKDGLADGIVITPSHNPPDDGGFKTILQTGAQPTSTRPPGSNRKPTNSCEKIWQA